MKIIAVSNGSCLLKKEYGKIIDSFDIVIRFNLFTLMNYRKHVGSKINIWCHNHNIRFIRKVHKWDCREIMLSHTNKNIKEFTAKGIEIVTQEVGQELIDEFDTGRIKLSTGLFGIYYLLKEFKQIYIVGFYKDDSDKNELNFRNLYFRTTKKDLPSRHRISKEKEIIDKLISQKRLIEIDD